MAEVETPEQVTNAIDTTTDPGFFARLKDLDWDLHLAYVSRNEPFRPNTDRNPYMAKLSEPFDEDFLKNNYGSGVYAVRLNKRNPKTGKDKTVEYYKATIIDENFPPRLVGYEGWEHDLRNQRWLWALPKTQQTVGTNGQGSDSKAIIDLLRDQLNRAQQQTPSGSVEGQAITRAMDVLTTAYKTGIENTKKDDSNNLSVVKEVLATVKELNTGKGDNGSAAIITLLTNLQAQGAAQLAAAQEANAKMVEKLIERAAPTSGVDDLIEKAGKLKDLKELFSGDGDSGGGSKRESTWEKVGGMLVEAIAPAMAPLGSALGRVILKNAGDREATTTELVPATPNPHAAGAGPVPVPDPQLQMVIDVAKLMRGAIELGLDGSEFAERFETKYGQTAYDTIVAVPQSEAITQLQAFPQAWAILKPYEAQMPEFLAAFYDYGQPDGEGTPAPEPQPKPRREKKVPV